MTDDNVSVKFGAETSAVTTGGQQVRGVLGGIMDAVRALGASFKAMGGAALEGFGEVTAGAKEGVAAITEISEAVTAARGLITGMGEAIIAALAVEQVAEFAKGMAENAEQVMHTAQTFGLTTAEVQRLKAEAAGAGVPFDAVTGAMMRLDRSMMTARLGSKQTSDAFKTIGVDITQPMTQTQLFSATLDGLANMDAGPAKVAAAMALLGRNIQGVGPLLSMSKEKLADLNTQTDEYGAVSETAERQGFALAESFNTQKVAAQGVGNVMTTAFAPILKAIVDDVNRLALAFIQSYNHGGEARTMMDVLAGVLRTLVATVDAVITSQAILWDTWKGVWNGIVALVAQSVNDIGRDAKALGQTFVDVGRVIYDALSNNVAAGMADLQATIKQVDQTAKVMGADLSAELKAFAAGAKPNFDKVLSDAQGFQARMKALFAPGAGAALPKAGTGTTDQDPTKTPKAPKTKGEESAMQKLQEAFDTEENSHNDMLRDMQADELAYWTRVMNSADMAALNDKDKAAVRMKVASLTHTEAMKGIQEEMTAWREAATAQEAAIQQAATARKAAIDQQIKDVEDAEKNGLLSHQTASARIAALVNQERQTAIAAANDILAVRIAADQQIMDHAASTTDAFKAALKDQTAAVTQFENSRIAADDAANAQIAARARATADQFRQTWDKTITPLVQDMGRGFLQMAEGARSFSQVMASVGNSILEMWIDSIAKSVSHWMMGVAARIAGEQVAQTGITAAKASGAAQGAAIDLVANLKEIVGAAASAAAKTYSAVAAIPVVGPFLAPEAAAGAFAAVMAFRGMVSAAGGADIGGFNPIAQLHAHEMVLPARLANPMRSMLADYGGSGGKGGGSDPSVSIGDTHVHGGTNMNRRQFERMLSDHRDLLVGAMKAAVRDRAFKMA